jgi:hypothetical protein
MGGKTGKTTLRRESTAIALIAAAMTAVFFASSLAIPPISEALMRNGFALRVSIRTIPALIERGERFDEIDAFLDKEIAKRSEIRKEDPDAAPFTLLYAFRGKLIAAREGPEAGCEYFAHLLRTQSLEEEVDVLEEYAACSALSNRWANFFALCRLLYDYGEELRVLRMIQNLETRGFPMKTFLVSNPGIRFRVHAEWERRKKLSLKDLPSGALSLYALWRLDTDQRLDNIKEDIAAYNKLAQERPTDLRALYLKAYSDAARGLGGETALELPPESFTRLCSPVDFTADGAPAKSGLWRDGGTFETELPAPRERVWFVARTTPAFHIYPLALIDLDGETSIHYLTSPREFPELLQRVDGKPFQSVKVSFVNDFSHESLKQDRSLEVKGIYDVMQRDE